MNKLIISLFFLTLAFPAFAQEQNPAPTEYTMLAPIPQLAKNGSSTDAVTYVTGLFKLIIGLAGVLAVVMIIYGGIKYMSTDAFSGKNEAKDVIENALWGLGLAIAAWLILYTINPKLVEIKFDIPKQEITTTGGGGGGGGGTPPIYSPSLTQEQALEQFRKGNVGTAPVNLEGVKQIIVSEIIDLKTSCGTDCEVYVTSATGGFHASGQCSHANGYKVDLRTTQSLTKYIIENFPRQPDRSDGARIYKSSSGAIYAAEGNHWDVAKCQ